MIAVKKVASKKSGGHKTHSTARRPIFSQMAVISSSITFAKFMLWQYAEGLHKGKLWDVEGALSTYSVYFVSA